MTHGILSNGTVDIPGTLVGNIGPSLEVRIDGDISIRYYVKSAWTFTPDAPVEPDLPYGVYATTVWRTHPEVSILWRYSEVTGWKALINSERETYHDDHPRDFYANRLSGNWWDLIVRLTAEEQ